MNDMIVGVDLAKSVFQLHGATADGRPAFRKKVPRQQFLRFLAAYPGAIIAMEACGSAHFWARELISRNHQVLMIPPQYVRPFVKRQKNDATDAEAIVTAARQPGMRFVPPKTDQQQARAVLFRARERLVHQRTELVNALRAVLYEFGYVLPAGLRQIGRVQAILDSDEGAIPRLVREECRDLLEQIAEQTARIDERTQKAHQLADGAETARRLQTLPGVGPITALAFDAFAPNMKTFRRGRDFAAWLGLVPRQHSSGGKERLGRITKAGQADIRRLLIIGAMSRLNWLGRSRIPEGSWLERMLARKPRMLVAIALANKMARAIWAMITKQQDYRIPVPAAATA